METENVGTLAFEQVKSGNFSGFFQTMRNAPIDWNMTGILFGIGFLSSFLFKRFYKMFLICCAVGGAFIWLLDHFFHVINWTAVNGIAGEVGAVKLDVWCEWIATWVAYNIVPTIAACFGFLIGMFV